MRDWFINTFGEKPFLAGYRYGFVSPLVVQDLTHILDFLTVYHVYSLVVCSAVSLGTLAPAVYGYMIGRGRGPVVHNLGNTVVCFCSLIQVLIRVFHPILHFPSISASIQVDKVVDNVRHFILVLSVVWSIWRSGT